MGDWNQIKAEIPRIHFTSGYTELINMISSFRVLLCYRDRFGRLITSIRQINRFLTMEWFHNCKALSLPPAVHQDVIARQRGNTIGKCVKLTS